MKLRNRPKDEGGQILVLIIGFGLAILLLISFVVDSSQVFLYQRALHSVADGAALDATDALDTGSIYEDGSDGQVRLSEELARKRVEEYARAARDTGHPKDFECALADFNAARVTVRCEGQATLPFVNTFTAGYGGAVEVPVEASAETFAD